MAHVRARFARNRRNDLIDLLVEAMTSDLSKEVTDNLHASDQFEADSALDHKVRHRKEIDELILVATAMTILVAGYDTTAQTLTYAGYRGLGCLVVNYSNK